LELAHSGLFPVRPGVSRSIALDVRGPLVREDPLKTAATGPAPWRRRTE
jgi:hypothetical protein